MKLWIDAGRSSAERVFGMDLIERHLKAVRHQKIDLSEVIIDVGAGPVPDWVAEPRLACPVRVVTGEGTCGDRLRAALAANEPLLATDAASLADGRLYRYLADRSGSCAVRANKATIARIEPVDASRILVAPTLDAVTAPLTEIRQDDFPAFVAKLRRSLPFYLFSVTNAAERNSVERFLFWSNYKGSTDFFTKYVYPPLVWAMVPPLARARIHPNTVTIVSIILTVLAVPLFATGHFWWGFACAYGMSVLDSVDGKLARLTFTDSAIGNVLDHGLDIVHPPFWYFGWAIGLLGGWAAADLSQPLWQAAWVMLALYILDRLILAVYRAKFKRGLHTHAAMDAIVRTFISRRNINLPLFTVAYAVGWGLEAFYFIVLWQALTCLYHGGRTIWILATFHPAPAEPV
ncbi:CDP-alcohol phosphatidyltransferase family protein [Dongia rigui]|uniref:CDP-alcohol phosphatidyltransferase family protein n=1 Tax=Dongia rigui TaxID=940149 RepID=A0ABU5E483_9PROT|nr:CDP-alcohol phosphatidyltransferase family protein [Dongia rigui]MDY0874299.1 CDP-alcohol phosphatidyltransferase family protein [Dongia rigui]